MNLNWKKLFDLSTVHQFGELKGSFFHIIPALETRTLMRNNSLLHRESKDGLTVLYSSFSESDEIVKPLTEKLKLRYFLNLNYLEFYNITDLPFDASKIVLFSNKQAGKDGDELPLHSESPAEEWVTEADSYEFASQTLRIEEESGTAVLYELLDENDKIIFSETKNPVEDTIFFEYDFSHRPAGLYKLRKDGVVSKTFYADNFLIKNKTFAVIEIHIGEGVPADYAIVDSVGTVTARSYKLKFKSRSTTWRYFVVTRNIELEDDDTLVVEGNSEITFSTGVSKTLPDGSAAFVFESASEFPLSKESQKNIALKKEDGVSKTLINQLPTPGASNMMIEEEKVYSDIFVYI